MIKLDYCQQQLLGVLLAEYPLLKEWQREEIYWKATTFVVATYQELKLLRREEICWNAIAFAIATCQSGVFNSCVSLVATLAVAHSFLKLP